MECNCAPSLEYICDRCDLRAQLETVTQERDEAHEEIAAWIRKDYSNAIQVAQVEYERDTALKRERQLREALRQISEIRHLPRCQVIGSCSCHVDIALEALTQGDGKNGE